MKALAVDRVGIALLIGVGMSILMYAQPAFAFPFGGRISQVFPCYNNAIYADIGPPVAGAYIWVNGSTKTYSFGPPTHAGQWLLGLAGAPYYCIKTLDPIDVRAGISITMMGSSQ